MEKNLELTPIPQNYENNVKWIMNSYHDQGITFPNGFQKDSIQNAVGARKTDSWDNWHCDIYVKENDKGTFVIVEDTGTVGLSGKNYSSKEVQKMMAEGIKLDSTDRLARFTSMFNSGDNKTGGGLYGAGKSVYSVASKDYIYYFDSLREDGLYVANANIAGQVYEKAFENEEAKKFIKDTVGLEPKDTIGTRIIISNPRDDLINSIETREINEYIEESWWMIIDRFDDSSSISINGEAVKIPEELMKRNAVHHFDLPNVEQYPGYYRIKHLGLYIFDKEIPTIWQGMSYYRKGMKIGEIELKDIPEKIEGKFWGYVEVDKEWETELAEVENSIHFGVSKNKKNKICYQYLKHYCQNKIKEKLIEWKYIKDVENEDKKLNNKLKDIADNIQNLFDKLGFVDLGIGNKKSDFDVRWQDIKYPNENTEKVTFGDILSFAVKINSTYTTDKIFKFKLETIHKETGEVLATLDERKINIKANTAEKIKLPSLMVNDENSRRFAENKIRLTVKVVGSSKEKVKELAYYYDYDKEVKTKECATLVLYECYLPRENSRRINFGESIRNVAYKIENKRNHVLNYKLNISMHNTNDPSNPKINDIKSFVGIINPFEDYITPYIEEIKIDEDIYEQYISEGTVELRARLIANKDDEQYEKGDKITSYNFKLYLNQDEKNGKKDSFEPKSVDQPDNFKRSWFETGTNRIIYINIGHPAYVKIQDDEEMQREYLTEQMLKQFVLLYLGEGKYDMFNDGSEKFEGMDQLKSIDQVLNKIERVYYENLR